MSEMSDKEQVIGVAQILQEQITAAPVLRMTLLNVAVTVKKRNV